jgi:hypothetical protein
MDRRRLRFKFDGYSKEPANDLITQARPWIWRGTDVAIEVGLFENGVNIDSVDNIDSLHLDILPGDAARDSEPLITKTATPGVIGDWEDQGETYNAVFLLTKSDTQVDLDDAVQNAETFWLVCHIVTNDTPSRYLTYGGADLDIVEDGAQNDVAASSGSRPSSPITGQRYFDATLGHPIWWNGSMWVNAMGGTVPDE